MAKPFCQRVVSTVGRAYSRDPFERVASIGGVNADRTRWSLSQPAAIAAIERGTDEFFFQVGDQRVRVVVVTHGGEKYLQSEREKTHPDELLNVVTTVPSEPPPVGRTAATVARYPRLLCATASCSFKLLSSRRADRLSFLLRVSASKVFR